MILSCDFAPSSCAGLFYVEGWGLGGRDAISWVPFVLLVRLVQGLSSVRVVIRVMFKEFILAINT